MKNTLTILLFAVSVICLNCNKQHTTPKPQWTHLLDQQLSRWDKFIGVPHYSIKGLPGYPKGDGMNGTPVGFNNDPLEVYKVEMENGEPVLHISGEIYGGLTTKEEYGDYHLKAEFKWGEKKYEPRLAAKRDNGILYHAYGPHGSFWNVWMRSHEFQVQEGDMGDYFALGPAADISAEYSTADNETEWMYRPGMEVKAFGDGGVSGRCRRQANYEKPHGEWNTLELVCLKGKSIHIVNGHVVMVLENLRAKDSTGQIQPLEKGHIQVQSEGAEAYYRNIQIRPITEIPEEYR